MASTRSRPRGRESARSPAGGVVAENATKIYGVAVVVVGVVIAFLALTSTGHVIDAATQRFMLYYAGVFALITLCASVGLGLIATDRMILNPGHRILIQSAHRAASFAAVAFLIIHIVTEILAQRVHALDAVVPFLSPFRTFYIGLGTLASDLVLLLVITGIFRKRFTAHGTAWRWRAIHYTSYVAFVFGVWHGLLGGRPGKPYVDWSYGFVVAAVALGLAVRILANSLRPKENLSAPPVPESAGSGSAPMRAASMFAQLSLVRAATSATALAPPAPSGMLSAPVDGWTASPMAGPEHAFAALPAATSFEGVPYEMLPYEAGPYESLQYGDPDGRQPFYEPGYEGPPRYIGAPRRANSGPMPRLPAGQLPRATTGPMPMAGNGPAHLRDSGPMPRATTGPMPMAGNGPARVRNSGPMPAAGNGAAWARNSGPMPAAGNRPAQVRDSGPMPAAGNGAAWARNSGPMPAAGNGPARMRDSGPMPRATGSGPMPRAASGPMSRGRRGPMPAADGTPGTDSGWPPDGYSGPRQAAGPASQAAPGSMSRPGLRRPATGPMPPMARRGPAISGPMPRATTGPMPTAGGSRPPAGTGPVSRPGPPSRSGGRAAQPGGGQRDGAQYGGRSAPGQARQAPGWAESGWAETTGWDQSTSWDEQGWMEPGGTQSGWAEPGWPEPGWEEPGWAGSPVWDGAGAEGWEPDPNYRYRDPGPGMPGYRGSRFPGGGDRR